jgi:hypothetical protein
MIDNQCTAVPQPQAAIGLESWNGPPLSNAERVQLRVQVIGLENLVSAILAEASERQPMLVQEMSAHITPRPGFTACRMTIDAANEMLRQMGRAALFSSRAA